MKFNTKIVKELLPGELIYGLSSIPPYSIVKRHVAIVIANNTSYDTSYDHTLLNKKQICELIVFQAGAPRCVRLYYDVNIDVLK